MKKVDEADPNMTLPGAVFEVYRKANEQEVATGEGLYYLEGYSAPMIRLSFYDNETMTGKPVSSVTSDEEGRITVFGLAYGTYYLLETDPPKGYTPPVKAAEILVNGESHMEEWTVTVENTSGAVLPNTGGLGVAPYYVLGGALVLAVLTGFLLRKKNNGTSELP